MNSFIDYMMSDDTAESAMKTMRESMANSQNRTNNLFYYYRKLDFGQSSTVRFLPISKEVAMSDEVKKRFSLAKKVIRLRFDNPEVDESKVVLTIPVMQMYIGGKTENDAILKQVKALYDESDRLLKAGQDERAKEVRERASYHWTRGEHLAQGFVVRSGFKEDNEPENPIRVFELNKQIMNRINAVCDPKVDADRALRYWPVHGKLGTNFVITKDRSGEWPSYNNSGFSTQGPTPWTDGMKAALETYDLWPLEEFLPERPTEDEYAMLAEIVRQSIAGETTWDPDWEAHLETVKVFKTSPDGTGSLGGGSTPAVSKIRDAMNRISAPAGAKLAETPTASDTSDAAGEEEVVPEETADDADDAPISMSTPQKSARDVRSIVDQLKRGGKVKAEEATA